MDATGAIRQKRWRTAMRDDGFSRASFFVSPAVKARLKSIAIRHGVTLSAAMEIAVMGYDDTAPASIEPAPAPIDDAPAPIAPDVIEDAPAIDTAAAVAIENSPAPDVILSDDFALGADTTHAPTDLERKILDFLKAGETSNTKIGEILGCHRNSVGNVKKRIKSGELRI